MNLLQVRRGLWVPRRGIVAGGGGLPDFDQTGLVGWWPLNGDFTEKLGKTMTNNNGVTHSADGLGPNGIGKAAVFDRALSQYLSRAHEAALAINGDMTVCVWPYPTYMATDIGIVEKNLQYGVTYDSAASGYPRTWFLGTGYQDTVDNSNDWTINTWQHYWMRHDATANTIELSTNNGTPTTITGVTNSPNGGGSAALEFGRFFGTNYFSGRLAEIVIFARKLTDDELTAVYGNGSNRPSHTSFNWV